MSVAISRRDAALYVALIVGGLFTVVLMGKYWRYQFAPFFMALIPLSAAGIDEAISYIRSEVVRHYVMIAAVICCSFIYYNPTAPLAFASGLLQHRDPFETATLARRRDPETGALAEREVLTYLNDPSRVHKSVEICGFDPYLRLDLSRPTVGPYVTFHSIGFRRDSTIENSYTDYQREWQHSYVSRIATFAPTFIVLNRKSPFWYLHDILTDVLDNFDDFTDFFRLYALDARFGGYEIYRRKDRQPR